MAKLDTTVFNRLRQSIDDFTDAAHRLAQQLDVEAYGASESERNNLERYRDQIAALGFQLDASDPEAGEIADAWAFGVDDRS